MVGRELGGRIGRRRRRAAAGSRCVVGHEELLEGGRRFAAALPAQERLERRELARQHDRSYQQPQSDAGHPREGSTMILAPCSRLQATGCGPDSRWPEADKLARRLQPEARSLAGIPARERIPSIAAAARTGCCRGADPAHDAAHAARDRPARLRAGRPALPRADSRSRAPRGAAGRGARVLGGRAERQPVAACSRSALAERRLVPLRAPARRSSRARGRRRCSPGAAACGCAAARRRARRLGGARARRARRAAPVALRPARRVHAWAARIPAAT